MAEPPTIALLAGAKAPNPGDPDGVLFTWSDVLRAQVLTVGPDGTRTEFWALADDHDAATAFWS